MEQALIGLLGVLVGLVVSEHFRRIARLESYSSIVFPKRLAAYEAFDKWINELNDLAADLINESRRPLPERQADWEAKTQNFFNFCFENRLYLSEDIVIHGSATLANVDAVLRSTESFDQKKNVRSYHQNLRSLRNMIRLDSGIQPSESLMRRIFKAKLTSKYLDIWDDKGRSIKE